MNSLVMVVDDEPGVLGFIKELLSIKGYDVEGFTNGIDAFSAFKKNPSQYKLVITDQTMPGMLGIELIQKAQEVQSVAAILCSGYSEKLDKDKAREFGVSEFISKPFEAKQLIDAVSNILEKDV